MKKQLKDDLAATAMIVGISTPFMAIYHWLCNWPWWVAIPSGLVSSYLLLCLLVAIPFILWGIVGD
jgi:hypothetical protein